MTKAVELAQVASTGVSEAFKNRLINGNMVIDQRNAGAAVSSHLAFAVDRFMMIKDTPTGSFTAQQSTVAPDGFINSLLYTVGTAFTPSSGQNNFFRQSIEGFNIADLGWGTANAKTVTLSFWVRSSLTGTFGGSLRNGASNRSYPFSYVISSANTFEYKTITITGDTSGTWLTNNGTGIELAWGVSVGSSFSNTAGSWYSGNFISVTGAVNLTSTAGATLYITGVQLEVGSTATSFDYRPYGTELALCQRYYEKSYNIDVVAGTNTGVGMIGGSGVQGATSTQEVDAAAQFKITKRATPTMTYYDLVGNVGKCSRVNLGVAVTNNQGLFDNWVGSSGFIVFSPNSATASAIWFHFTASSEL